MGKGWAIALGIVSVVGIAPWVIFLVSCFGIDMAQAFRRGAEDIAASSKMQLPLSRLAKDILRKASWFEITSMLQVVLVSAKHARHVRSRKSGYCVLSHYLHSEAAIPNPTRCPTYRAGSASSQMSCLTGPSPGFFGNKLSW